MDKKKKNRIRYFDLNDLYTNINLINADNFLDKFLPKKNKDDINEIIECYNILKYINQGVVFKKRKDIEKKLQSIIGIFIGKNKEIFLQERFDKVESILHSDFWSLFSDYKIYNYYSNDSFQNFILKSKPYIKDLLVHKGIVDKFTEEIKEYLISNEENVPLLIEYFEFDGEGIRKEVKLYLPKSLTYLDIDTLFQNYITSNNPNINLLNLITTLKNTDEVKLSDKTRLLARRRSEKETDLFFEKNTGHEFGVSIKFIPNYKEGLNCSYNNRMTDLTYDLNWIKENFDYNTLLNNFIYLFEYVDWQMRINLISKKNDIKSIESIFSSRSKNHYKDGWTFNLNEQISNIQMYSYVQLLEDMNINIEVVYEWFYTSYLSENFKIENYGLHIPSKNTSYFEKCRILLPEIESTFKKYNLFVEEGAIDTELLSISSKPLSISDCKSIYRIKNIYQNIKDYDLVCYYLFSDQCMLSYIKEEDKSYKSFYNLLLERERVLLSDFQDYLKPEIEWLLNNNYIITDKHNQIHLKDPIKVSIIYNLYINETINYINCPGKYITTINKLLDENELKYSSTLLSKPESQYFNYYLNKSEFTNSHDLRNMYVHGTQPDSDKNSNIHKFNYITILKLLVLITIKINDELCNKELQSNTYKDSISQ